MLIRNGVFGQLGVVVAMAGAAFFCFSASVAEPAGSVDAGATRHVPASMSAKEYDAMLDDIAETCRPAAAGRVWSSIRPIKPRNRRRRR